MNEQGKNKNSLSQLMYIFEASLEYLISILVASSFLATLTKELGMSDSLTGILTAFISLGCLFQLLSMMIRKNRVKPLVIVMSVANQLLFMLLYVIPLIPISKQLKIALFVILLILAYFIYYLVHPKKINWLMSLVDDRKRGSFTAKKEIVSLIIGIIFTFLMSAVVDHFRDTGNIKTAFIISAVVIFIIMLLHTLSMLMAEEKPISQDTPKTIKDSIANALSDKNILTVIMVFIFYYISKGMTLPFYGTYTIHELGLSLKYISFLTFANSTVRILFSMFWGKYADKKSFAAMIEKCFIFLLLASVAATLAVPSNGKIMFFFYYAFQGIALAGVNSAMINLVFDYVAPEKRADSLAICQAAAGLVGFLTTLASSALLEYIQRSGNSIFGISLYAQQFLSLISIFFLIVGIVYIRIVLIRKKS